MYAATAAAAPQKQDRRNADRLDFTLEVSGESGHQFFTGFAENISTGGLFIATYQTLPVGTRLRVGFRVPGLDRNFECDSEVRWVREYSDHSCAVVPGIGVRFLNLSAADTAQLDQQLSRLETLFFE
ncbi:MAG: TIGR02266 family protein [Myxococcales bacterium]|nr:TIGR02266 family protein [Myxococcales bacterium]